MNISMIVLNPFTHDARVMKEAQTLAAAGHHVTVNALWAPGLPASESRGGIQVQRIRLRSRQGLYIPMAVWLELLPKFNAALRLQQPETVHAHDLNALIPGYFAARSTGARLIYDAHEFETGRTTERSGSSRLRRWAWGRVEAALIRRADAVFTVSTSIAEELSRLYPIPTPHIVRNCPELIDLPPQGRLRSALGIPPDQAILLFQGVLAEGRGLENALRAVAQVPAARLVMVGDGPLRSRLETLASELGVHDRLSFTGRVPLDTLLEYTRDATLGLCLTENTCLNHYYSLPNKLFEYLMVGVPVLASRFPDMRSVIEETGAGITSDPADTAGMARLLQDLLADQETLRQMAVKARQAAVTRYNWAVEAQTLLSTYAHLPALPLRIPA